MNRKFYGYEVTAAQLLSSHTQSPLRTQRGAPALLLAEEASEQVNLLDRLFLCARLPVLAEILAARVLLSRGRGRGSETGGERQRLSVLGARVSARRC